MKKNYMPPEMEILRFETESVLAPSVLLKPDENSEDAPVAGGVVFGDEGFQML